MHAATVKLTKWLRVELPSKELATELPDTVSQRNQQYTTYDYSDEKLKLMATHL